MPARRYNCRCGKRRYRDEGSALAASDADQNTYGDVVTVYRCPGGLAWHLSAHGFTPEALRSTGRRLAFELVEQQEVDLEDFRARSDRRRWERIERCAEQLTELGLARRGEGSLIAVDRAGLLRVVQIGLDAYAEEHPHRGYGSKR